MVVLFYVIYCKIQLVKFNQNLQIIKKQLIFVANQLRF